MEHVCLSINVLVLLVLSAGNSVVNSQGESLVATYSMCNTGDVGIHVQRKCNTVIQDSRVCKALTES